MKVAVLPYNALGDTNPALGRQLAAFAAEQLRVQAGAEVNMVQMLTQVQQPEGVRIAFVNIGDDLLNAEQIAGLFQQADVDVSMDGSIRRDGDSFDVVRRFHRRDEATPFDVEEFHFTTADLFPFLHGSLKKLAQVAEAELPAEMAGDTMEFGTDDPNVFLHFLEGYDAVAYIQQAQGMVAREFTPQASIDSLTKAIEADADFEGPYQALVQLCRLCGGHRIGTFEGLEAALRRATELVPDDAIAYFALGELYEGVGQVPRACDLFEKAATMQPEDPGLWTRLGVAQMRAGMPVNAERNFRKALDLEGSDKPSTQFLADVLFKTGRAHEVPALWKAAIDANPQNALAHAQYAMSLIQDGKATEGEKVFEDALETLEEPVVVKRFYAPYLGQKGDLDRAMDFFEDCIDEVPADPDLRLQYAQVLQAAKREFEIPQQLKDILAMNPNPNLRAQTLAWLIELEQPKRAETVEKARERMAAADFVGAIRDLKPMRNWLADYWKMWALLAAAYNHEQEYAEAEEAARRLIELFPACEPAYGEFVTALVGQNRAEEAFRVMGQVQANHPQSLSMAVNLMRAAHHAGHHEVSRQLAKQLREAVGTENEELNAVLQEVEAD